MYGPGLYSPFCTALHLSDAQPAALMAASAPCGTHATAWHGENPCCFVPRQHKTLELLETNYQTAQALQLGLAEPGPAAGQLEALLSSMAVDAPEQVEPDCFETDSASDAAALGSKPAPILDYKVPETACNSQVLYSASSQACWLSGPCPVQADDDIMSVDGDAPAERGKAGRRARYSEEFKAKVVAVLDQHGFTEQRGAKLAQDDFLRLLAAFNAAGIHFA